MARKKKPEDPVNHERWLVSYADFITLLFAFFVVMYSLSSVNEGKYRVLSDSMSVAFRPSTRSMQPVQVGQISRTNQSAMPTILEISRPINIIPQIVARPPITNELDTERESEEDYIEEASKQIDEIAKDVADSLASLIDSDEIVLKQSPLWLEVEINSSLLFTSASADLSGNAEVILGELGDLISAYPNNINVEGFTDNRPIQNSIYPSNWELSSARAAAVVRLFEAYNVDPTRMVSIGYGEFRPNSTNDNDVGRASNRKVTVVIMANIQDQEGDRQFSDLELLRQRTNR